MHRCSYSSMRWSRVSRLGCRRRNRAATLARSQLQPCAGRTPDRRPAVPEATRRTRLYGYIAKAAVLDAAEAIAAATASEIDGVPDAQLAAVPDARLAAVPDARLAAVPDARLAAVPDARLAAVPDARLAAVPDARLAAVP